MVDKFVHLPLCGATNPRVDSKMLTYQRLGQVKDLWVGNSAGYWTKTNHKVEHGSEGR